MPCLRISTMSFLPRCHCPLVGVTECVPSNSSRGTVMRQMVPLKPVTWWPGEARPFAVFQAALYANSDMSLDVMLPAEGDGAMLGARANPNACAAPLRVIDCENLMPGEGGSRSRRACRVDRSVGVAQ